MSLSDIQDVTGIDRGQLSRIERGKGQVNADRLQMLAAALRTTVAELVGERLTHLPHGPSGAAVTEPILVPVEQDVLRRDGLMKSRGAFDALVPIRLDRGPAPRPAKHHEAITHPDATDRWFVVMVDQPMPPESKLQLMDRIIFRPDDLELLGEDQIIVYGRDEPDTDTELEVRLGTYHAHRGHAWALPLIKGNPPVPLGGPEGWRVIAKAVELRRNLDLTVQSDLEDLD